MTTPEALEAKMATWEASDEERRARTLGAGWRRTRGRKSSVGEVARERRGERGGERRWRGGSPELDRGPRAVGVDGSPPEVNL